MRAFSSIFLALLAIGALSFKRVPNAPDRKITLIFHHRMGTQPLTLGEPVRTAAGETITVERFRYYVSNFSLDDANGVAAKTPAEYFLIDQEDSSSRTITITLPANKGKQLSFLLGVDSLRNVSGIQTGALDPMHGMFWTWNSGYVMAKLEGTSDSVASAGNRFTYHVGGFRPGMNVLKRIHLPLPDNQEIHEIHIDADLDHWFAGATRLKVSETPVCHSPGALAMRIADNYSSMFSIQSVR